MAKLVIKNLHVTVEGKEILKGIDLTIDESNSLAILGPNGHGKSTLLNVISGLDSYEDGEMYINGKEKYLKRNSPILAGLLERFE